MCRPNYFWLHINNKSVGVTMTASQATAKLATLCLRYCTIAIAIVATARKETKIQT